MSILTAIATAAFGGSSGLLAGVIPDVKKYFLRKQEMEIARLEHDLEMEKLEFSATQDLVKHNQKYDEQSWDHMRETDQAIADQIIALNKAQAELAKNASPFVANWNAVLRPAFFTVVIGLFTFGALMQFAYIVYLACINWGLEGNIAAAINMFWDNQQISQAITGVTSFLMGYRSARKLPKS